MNKDLRHVFKVTGILSILCDKSTPFEFNQRWSMTSFYFRKFDYPQIIIYARSLYSGRT